MTETKPARKVLRMPVYSYKVPGAGIVFESNKTGGSYSSSLKIRNFSVSGVIRTCLG